MSWKSYVVVSGATVLAGWLASTPPANAPDGAASGPAREPGAAGGIPASDIEREAERLQVRVQREITYAPPQRNPFRFGAGRAAEGGGDMPGPPSAAPPPTAALAVVPPPPPVSLAGIAEDQKGDLIERTAILSSPSGVLLLREGDAVLDYRVARIEREAVELVKTDGSTLRLTLSNPKSQIPTPND
jgi:hypothetical protein